MEPEKPEQQETKQLTTGEKSGAGIVQRVREGSAALKERGVIPQDLTDLIQGL